MFRRVLYIGHFPTRLNLFGEAVRRYVHKDGDGENIVLVPGGGLEKLQGGIKEEKYFNDHDLELLAKMRADSSKKLKCETCVDNWNEFEKVLHANETCSLNKYKNCTEEAHFLNEQTISLKHLADKLKNSPVTAKAQNLTSGDGGNSSGEQ